MKKNEKSENATLADLPVGASAKIVKILPDMRGKKKFADVGIMPGTELILEAKAPFGGLLRVKVMETSMAFHSEDAKNILIGDLQK
ncbi:FeoA family protein [Opitutia bacterium KCR 482]|nr:FeoA family protein [Opitutae bacterium KCR 482]